MISQHRLTLLLLLLAALGCSGPVIVQRPSSPVIPEDTFITLDRRGVCHGICPTYKLTISGDGSVVYEGKHDVINRGVVEGKISSEQLRQLISEFERIEFFSLRYRYTQGSEDCIQEYDHGDRVIISIRINGRVKEVEHWTSCERVSIYSKLADLEKKIEEAVGVQQWTF